MSTRVNIRLPKMVGTDKFQPTGLQIQCLCGYIEGLLAKTDTEPVNILAALGRDKSNWYHWLKKDGFIEWWGSAIEEYFTGHGLKEVHKSIYINALGNSPQDRKLYLERFDSDYKPAKREEHSFPGLAPPKDIQAAIERSRQRAKMFASKVVEDSPEPVQDGRTPDGDVKA